MLLVGSRSLCHFLDLGRSPDDWDIKVTATELSELEKKYILKSRGNGKYFLRLNGDVIEITDITHRALNKALLDYAEDNNLPSIQTPIGIARDSSIGIHYVLKKTGVYKLGKNHRDLRKIEMYMEEKKIVLPEGLQHILNTYKEKQEFFEKYDITRYVEHDTLHDWVANGIKYLRGNPTYKKILIDSVTPSNVFFVSLTEADKESIMVEEAIVLTLERWFLYQCSLKRHPQDLWRRFMLCDKSGDPTVRWLDKLSGGLKDHPQFLSDWCFDNYDAVKRRLLHYLWNLQLPVEFWKLAYDLWSGQHANN